MVDKNGHEFDRCRTITEYNEDQDYYETFELYVKYVKTTKRGSRTYYYFRYWCYSESDLHYFSCEDNAEFRVTELNGQYIIHGRAVEVDTTGKKWGYIWGRMPADSKVYPFLKETITEIKLEESLNDRS